MWLEGINEPADLRAPVIGAPDEAASIDSFAVLDGCALGGSVSKFGRMDHTPR